MTDRPPAVTLRTAEMALAAGAEGTERGGQPDLRPLPDTWKAAEHEYNAELAEIKKLPTTSTPQKNLVNKRLILARQRLLRSATSQLHQIAEHPGGFRDPSVRMTVANIVAATAQSLLGFTASVGLAEVLTKLATGDGYGDPDAPTGALAAGGGLTEDGTRIALFSALVAVLNTAGEDAGRMIRRGLGGAEMMALLPSRGAVAGPYRAEIGRFLVALANTAVYAAINAPVRQAATEGLGADSFRNIGSLGGRTAVGMAGAAAAGAGAALVMQGALVAGARATLSRYSDPANEAVPASGPISAMDLPRLAHNRSSAAGVYAHGSTPWRERVTLDRRISEEGRRLVANLLGSVAMATMLSAMDSRGFGDGIDNATGERFIQVVLAFAAFFAVRHLAGMASTLAVDDPRIHANRQGISASEVTVDMLRKASLGRFEDAVDEAKTGYQSATFGTDQERQTASDVGSVLQGLSLTSAELNQKAGAMAQAIEALKPGIERLSEMPSHADLSSVANKIEASRGALKASLESLQRLTSEQTPANKKADLPSIHHLINDITHKIRDLQAHIVAVEMRVGSNDSGRNLASEDRFQRLVADMLPLFVGLRQRDGDVKAQAFLKTVEAFDRGTTDAATLVKTVNRSAPGDLRVASIISQIEKVPGQNNVAFYRAVEKLEQKLDTSAFDSAKFMLLKHHLNRLNPDLQDQLGTPADDGAGNLRRLHFGTLTSVTGDKNVDSQKQERFRQDFVMGRVSIDELKTSLREEIATKLASSDRDAISPRHRNDEETLEMSDARHSRIVGRSVENLKSNIDSGLFKLLGKEHGFSVGTLSSRNFPLPSPSSETVQDKASQVIQGLWEDVAGFPDRYRMILEGAFGMAPPANTGTLPRIEKHDSHYHPTSYSGRINDLRPLLRQMDANGIDRSVLSGIPSQVHNARPEAKYYLNARARDGQFLYYRDHDHSLAALHKALPEHDQQRLDLFMTGFDITDGPAVGRAMDERMWAYPGGYRGVGEITEHKEVVQHLNQAGVASRGAVQAVYKACAERGLPIVYHNDRGKTFSKDKFADTTINDLRTLARSVHHWPANDPLAQHMKGAPPPMRPKIVWAHGAGISRFTSEARNHTRQLEDMLSDDDLKDLLYLDLAWDYVGLDILQNTVDLLSERKVSPRLRESMATLVKAYTAFTTSSALADKASDIGQENHAALYRLAGEDIAANFESALENFQEIVREQFGSDETKLKEHFSAMIDSHGDKGNNWIYIFANFKDRLMFGTDALAIGTKAHGNAAYATNVRFLDPMFILFQEFAAARNEVDTVTPQIAKGTYEHVFHDPEVGTRRQAWEEALPRMYPDWSTSMEPMTRRGPENADRARWREDDMP